MMTSVNVSMPEAMKEFIEVTGAEGQYSTPSEFVRELVREFQHRHVLEILEPNLRRRIDQKLLAALDRGEALPGEQVMPELRKKHQARA